VGPEPFAPSLDPIQNWTCSSTLVSVAAVCAASSVQCSELTWRTCGRTLDVDRRVGGPPWSTPADVAGVEIDTAEVTSRARCPDGLAAVSTVAGVDP
jgi:hypothetical protein